MSRYIFSDYWHKLHVHYSQSSTVDTIDDRRVSGSPTLNVTTYCINAVTMDAINQGGIFMVSVKHM